MSTKGQDEGERWTQKKSDVCRDSLQRMKRDKAREHHIRGSDTRNTGRARDRTIKKDVIMVGIGPCYSTIEQWGEKMYPVKHYVSHIRKRRHPKSALFFF